MSVRLVITLTAAPGRGAELARAMKERCAAVQQEPGCEQFEAFQGVADPDTIVLLERWTDQAALDVHSKLNVTRPPLASGLIASRGEREDYTFNRTG